MSGPVDKLGVPIRVGSTVCYACVFASTPYIRIAKVLDVENRGSDDWNHARFALRVQADDLPKPTTIYVENYMGTRLVVLP